MSTNEIVFKSENEEESIYTDICVHCRKPLLSEDYKKYLPDLLTLAAPTLTNSTSANTETTVIEALSYIVGLRFILTELLFKNIREGNRNINFNFKSKSNHNKNSLSKTINPDQLCFCSPCEQLLQDLYICHQKFSKPNSFIVKHLNENTVEEEIPIFIEKSTQTGLKLENGFVSTSELESSTYTTSDPLAIIDEEIENVQHFYNERNSDSEVTNVEDEELPILQVVPNEGTVTVPALIENLGLHLENSLGHPVEVQFGCSSSASMDRKLWHTESTTTTEQIIDKFTVITKLIDEQGRQTFKRKFNAQAGHVEKQSKIINTKRELLLKMRGISSMPYVKIDSSLRKLAESKLKIPESVSATAVQTTNSNISTDSQTVVPIFSLLDLPVAFPTATKKSYIITNMGKLLEIPIEPTLPLPSVSTPSRPIRSKSKVNYNEIENDETSEAEEGTSQTAEVNSETENYSDVEQEAESEDEYEGGVDMNSKKSKSKQKCLNSDSSVKLLCNRFHLKNHEWTNHLTDKQKLSKPKPRIENYSEIEKETELEDEYEDALDMNSKKSEPKQKCLNSDCGKLFCNSFQLRTHEWTNHLTDEQKLSTPRPEMKYKCLDQRCGQVFQTFGGLKQHKCIHCLEKAKIHNMEKLLEIPIEPTLPLPSESIPSRPIRSKSKVNYNEIENDETSVAEEETSQTVEVNSENENYSDVEQEAESEDEYEDGSDMNSKKSKPKQKQHKLTHCLEKDKVPTLIVVIEKNFKCLEPECGKAFSDQRILEKHKFTHLPEEDRQIIMKNWKYKCSEVDCGLSYPNACELKQHQVTHLPSEERLEKEKYKCLVEDCGKIFGRGRDLRRHRDTHLPMDQRTFNRRAGSGIKNFKCLEPDCDKKFDTTTRLKRHQNIHLPPELRVKFNIPRYHKCLECGKFFTGSCQLKRHQESHMIPEQRVRNFACPICDKKFPCVNKRNAHIRTHAEEKCMLCPECGKTFRDNSQLKSHMMHHANERMFKCKECGKGFNNNTALKLHSLVHTKDRHFVCDVCGKSFKSKMHLDYHTIQHKNERVHKCMAPECTADFNYRHHLGQHLGQVHKIDKNEIKMWMKNPTIELFKIV